MTATTTTRTTGAVGGSGERRADVAYAWLKDRLLSGSYAFGDDLSIVDVASEISMSRQPVMEAVKRLQLEGFVEIIPQVGCRIAIPSVRAVRDLFEVFATLESLVTRLAAERRHVDDAAATLRPIVARLQVLSGARLDVAHHRILNRQFHGAIHGLAASDEARRAAEVYWDRSDFLIATAGEGPWAAHLELGNEEHNRLADAVIGGNAVEAAHLAYGHIRDFGNVVIEGMQESGISDTALPITTTRSSA